MNKHLLSALCFVMLAANAMGVLPGQIIVDPQTPRWFVYNRDSDGDGKLDPFYLGGAGGPEDFFFRGTRNADGTRNGGTNRRSSTRWVRPESMASTWRPSERTAGMPIPIPLTTRS